MTPEHIIAFVRPHELEVMRRLARELRESFGRSTPIRFLTMWTSVASQLLSQVRDGETVISVGDLVRYCRVSASDRQELERLERDLVLSTGTPLRTMLDAERLRPRDAAVAEEFAWRHFKVIASMIPERAILLSGAVDHLCYWLAADITRLRGGLYFGFSNSGRPSMWTQIARSATGLWMPRQPRPEHKLEVAKQVADIRAGVKPGYMTPRKPDDDLRRRLARHRLKLDGLVRRNYLEELPGASRIRSLSHRSRWAVTKTMVEFRPLDAVDRPFIYFPLHFGPEMSTYVYAPRCRDEGYLIDTIAKSLPVGVDLVIKENPKMWGGRPVSFYRRAAEHPGVHWVDPTTPTELLTQRASAVLTITGTVAIEAAALGRPIAMFASPPFHDALRSIPLIRNLDDLPRFLTSLLAGETGVPSQETFEKEMATYIANLVPFSYAVTERLAETPVPSVKYQPEYLRFLRDALAGTAGLEDHSRASSSPS